MRDATALPADLLDGELAAARDDDDAGAAVRISHIAQLADRGDHAAAAREAATLLEARVYDVRLIGFYLFGLFLQRGLAELPALLDRLGRLVAEHLDVLRPARRKLQVVNSATASLFEQVSTRVQFHAKQRDATWDAWRAGSDLALADAIAASCARVSLALEAVIEAPLAAAPLARLRRWASDDLRRAMARREAIVEHIEPLASGAIRGLLDPPGAPREAPAGAPDSAPDGATASDRVTSPARSIAPVPGAGAGGNDAGDNDAGGNDAGDDDAGDDDAGDDDAGDDDAGDDDAGDGDAGDDDAGFDAPGPASLAAMPGDREPPAWRGGPEAYPASAAGSAATFAADPVSDPAATSAVEPAASPVAVGSPALATLQAKLRGFQRLIARGELARAAVVASDVRAVIAGFDPVTFFPTMFAAYFKALHQVIDELAPYLDGSERPAWHALDSYYRADMRGFFED